MIRIERRYPAARNRTPLPPMSNRTRRRQSQLDSLDQLQELLLNLRAARERRGITIDELASRTGLEAAVLADLESGGWSEPTVEILVRYAEALGKKLVVLLYDA